MRAVLHGGPEDGKVVDVLGSCYQKHICINVHTDPPPWPHALYLWAYEPDGSIVGRFAGFFRSGTQVEIVNRQWQEVAPEPDIIVESH